MPDNSHVTYMSEKAGCPESHPVQFPQLFIEVLYFVSGIVKQPSGRFVFAQGDPTGYGFHDDFLNGWDQSVLAAAVAGGKNSCVVAAGGPDTVLTCAAFEGLYEYPNNCPQSPPIFNETGESPLSQVLVS